MNHKNKSFRIKTKTGKALAYLLILLTSCFSGAIFTQYVPAIFIGKYQVEMFLLIVGTLLFLLYIFFKFGKWVYGFISFCWLIFSIFLLAKLGWQPRTIWVNAANSVDFLFTNNPSSFEKVDIKPAQKAIAPHITLQQRIQLKVNHTDTLVRNFSVEKSLLYFDQYYAKYRQICRQFSLIKYIKENYKYVSDPAGFDYFASPQESIRLMAGDCDDYSILMASCLEAIGANVRIIWAPNHVYPELYCGDKSTFEKYVNAIYSCFDIDDQLKEKSIYYRLDKNNEYWLNLDYTDNYPGSKYQSEEVLSIIYIH